MLATVKTEKKIITDKKLELIELSEKMPSDVARAEAALRELEANPGNYNRNYTAGGVLVALGFVIGIGLYPGLVLYEKVFVKFACPLLPLAPVTSLT